MAAIEGFVAIHDLHVWSLTSGKDVLSAHVVSDSGRGEQELLGNITEVVSSFGLHHSTVQIEAGSEACKRAEQSSVHSDNHVH